MRCVFLCAVLLNSVVVGMSQDDAYPDQVFLNEPAQLALPEGVPIEEVVKARNERIRREVAALIEKVTKTGVAIPGIQMYDSHAMILGKFHPHLIPIGYPLDDCLRDVKESHRNVAVELVVRGFPYEDLKVVHKYKSDLSYENYSKRKHFPEMTRVFNQLKQKKAVTDEEINEYYFNFNRAEAINLESWSIQFLRELTPRARRVILSYIFEEYTPYLGWGAFIKADAIAIDKFRSSPPFHNEGVNK